LSIYQKLADAQAALGDIHRDKTVNVRTKTGGSYSYAYVTEDAITKALRTTLSPMGVAMTVSWTNIERDGDLTTVTGVVTFGDGETGETVSITIFGCGSDSSDKGLSKAQTSALRIGLCKTFLQAGDPDAQSHELAQPRKQDQVRVITDAQRRALFAAARAKGLTEEELRVYVSNERAGNSSTRDLPVAAFDKIMKRLEELPDVKSPPDDGGAS
jgi:hypothetical protein